MSNIDVKQYEFNELSRKSDIKSAIESMLFVSGEPLPLREISNNLELREKNVVEILQEMTTEYEDKSRGIRLISLDEAYQLVTKSENSEFVQKLLKKNKKHSLSQASIESLAIIAYKQPITRIDIDEIRGVKSESAITRLVERGLIKDVGRLEVPGRPILYGTTDEFLRQFGLKTIKELPSLDLYGDEGVQSSMDLLNKAIEDIDLEENKIFITSQNHGYYVSEMPENMEVTHINLNDNTVEGMRHKELPIYSVQYHPEACPGPKDNDYIFDKFLELV